MEIIVNSEYASEWLNAKWLIGYIFIYDIDLRTSFISNNSFDQNAKISELDNRYLVKPADV